ncbi:hypothetical protein LOTGIDRAFT_141551, partial [Lottia gigantea]
APQFIIKPRRQLVDEGDSTKFKASFEGSSNTQVTWSKDGKEILPDDHCKAAINKNRFKLTIGKVVPGDAGAYVCEAYNEFGESDTFCNLSIREIEKSLPPDFITKPKLTKVTEGADAIFSCTVVGFPLPNVYWERNGKILQDCTKYQV